MPKKTVKKNKGGSGDGVWRFINGHPVFIGPNGPEYGGKAPASKPTTSSAPTSFPTLKHAITHYGGIDKVDKSKLNPKQLARHATMTAKSAGKPATKAVKHYATYKDALNAHGGDASKIDRERLTEKQKEKHDAALKKSAPTRKLGKKAAPAEVAGESDFHREIPSPVSRKGTPSVDDLPSDHLYHRLKPEHQKMFKETYHKTAEALDASIKSNPNLPISHHSRVSFEKGHTPEVVDTVAGFVGGISAQGVSALGRAARIQAKALGLSSPDSQDEGTGRGGGPTVGKQAPKSLVTRDDNKLNADGTSPEYDHSLMVALPDGRESSLRDLTLIPRGEEMRRSSFSKPHPEATGTMEMRSASSAYIIDAKSGHVYKYTPANWKDPTAKDKLEYVTSAAEAMVRHAAHTQAVMIHQGVTKVEVYRGLGKKQSDQIKKSVDAKENVDVGVMSITSWTKSKDYALQYAADNEYWEKNPDAGKVKWGMNGKSTTQPDFVVKTDYEHIGAVLKQTAPVHHVLAHTDYSPYGVGVDNSEQEVTLFGHTSKLRGSDPVPPPQSRITGGPKMAVVKHKSVKHRVYEVSSGN